MSVFYSEERAFYFIIFEICFVIFFSEEPTVNTTKDVIVHNDARPIRFNCKVEGIPKPKVTWLKNGHVLQARGRTKVSLKCIID